MATTRDTVNTVLGFIVAFRIALPFFWIAPSASLDILGGLNMCLLASLEVLGRQFALLYLGSRMVASQWVFDSIGTGLDLSSNLCFICCRRCMFPRAPHSPDTAYENPSPLLS